MALRTSFAAKAQLHGQLKLARLLEMSEGDFESQVLKIERDPLFERLRATGAVVLEPYEGVRHGSRRLDGWILRDAGASDGLDAGSAPIRLIQRLGRERFEEFFLRGRDLDDRERARACGLTLEDVRLLRDFVDRLHVQAEFSPSGASAASPKTFSPVAGVDIVDGRPAVAFFNREIWKGRYRVHPDKCALLRDTLSPRERRRLENLLRRLEFLDRRKSTLYRILGELLHAQADFFLSGDLARRRPLTQRDLADRIDASPSVLNRLISNKSIQLPWGLETPLRTLVPSAKTLTRDRLYDLAVENPDSSDEILRRKLEKSAGARLSRRSIAQYRQELGLGGRRRRRR